MAHLVLQGGMIHIPHRAPRFTQSTRIDHKAHSKLAKLVDNNIEQFSHGFTPSLIIQLDRAVHFSESSSRNFIKPLRTSMHVLVLVPIPRLFSLLQ
jgi:hypothetical protein